MIPGVGVTGGAEDEDEAAKAVRSILGHNDLVAEADKSGNVHVVGVVRNLRQTVTNFVESPHHQSHEATGKKHALKKYDQFALNTILKIYLVLNIYPDVHRSHLIEA